MAAKAVRWTREQIDAYVARRTAGVHQLGPDLDAVVVTYGTGVGGGKTNKYAAKPTEGEASKKQARRLSELRLMAEAGQIRGLARQPEYVLIPKQLRECGELIERKMTYIADFVYEEWSSAGWRLVVEDVKGYATPGYVQKRKLMLAIHGIEIRET